MTRVALLHALARDGGGTTRLRWWREVVALTGAEPVEVPLLGAAGCPWPPGFDQLGPVAAGSAPPEALAWPARRARRALASLGPDAVVAVTLRAHSPAALSGLAPDTPVIVDAVDQLSASYRQRALLARRVPERMAWGVLARSMARCEREVGRRPAVMVAAGRGDAARLGAVWLPITVPSAAVRPARPAGPAERLRWDVLFAGTLDYPPNVAAVRALAATVWPAVVRQWPRARLCVAGRRPAPEVRRLVAGMGATLIDEFDNYADLAAEAAVAIAPLPVATGFQIKVLDAAAAGVPQVVSPAALAGYAPGLAVRSAPVGEAFADEIVALLEDPPGGARLAAEATEQVRRSYTTEGWAPVVAGLLTGGERPETGAPSS